MPATLKDIAGVCGVDVSTVSRALRDDPLVNERTRKRIKAVARGKRYYPNLAARALVAGKSRVVWFFVPFLQNILEQVPAQYASFYLSKFGYDTMVVLHQNNDVIYSRLLERLSQGVADGAIIIPAPEKIGKKHLEPLLKRKYPLVFIDRYPRGIKTPTVTNDNFTSGMELVRLARENGSSGIIDLFGTSNNAESARKNGVKAGGGRYGCDIFHSRDLFDRKGIQVLLPKNLAIMASSQNRIHHFMNEHSWIIDNRNLLFCCYDQWYGEPYPAGKVFVAIQNFEKMSEHACDILLSLIEKKKKNPLCLKVPLLEIKTITPRF